MGYSFSKSEMEIISMKRRSHRLVTMLSLTALFLCLLGPGISESGEWISSIAARGIKAYPDLKESVWIQRRPPFGPYDIIGLHRVVKANAGPREVLLYLPGRFCNAENNITNPPESVWTWTESYNFIYYLANRNFDIYAINYKTHYMPWELESEQLSFMADWGWDQWMGDIKEAVDFAKKISRTPKIYIAGQSFGGFAAMNYAARHWKEDLKGILLLDGGPAGRDLRKVTNEYDLPAQIREMNAKKTWAIEPRFPRALYVIKYALANPKAPAIEPGTNKPLDPPRDPTTGNPWPNITKWYEYRCLYRGFPSPGGMSNIYAGYNEAGRCLQFQSRYDRWWPTRLALETAAMNDWNHCPYVTHDFDDLYQKINVPLLNFVSGLFGASYWGGIKPGIAHPDYTGINLPGYGHLDVYFGTHSQKDVSAPAYEWLTRQNRKSSRPQSDE
jgi:pimeloyl-ACP methyl ester carboxylesterase